MSLLKMTRSLCPKCHKIISASVVEEGGKVWLDKTCDADGTFRELYWSDAEMYKRAEKYSAEGKGVSNPAINIDSSKAACPYNCGLCTAHKSHTILGNIFVTNRCNKRCWYCFAGIDNIRKNGFVYEPTFSQIKEMLQTLRDEQPVPVEAVQFTGGEPTIRDDMLEIVREAAKMGFKHIQLNTNGIMFALDPDLPKKYRDAGVNVAYMSFDGVSEKTNPKNHKYVPQIIRNCRKAGLPLTLVPTLINTVNDNEIWDIVKFAINNIDIVRSVNFQPVSFVGAMDSSSDEKRRNIQRITIPDLEKKLEKQSNGAIPASSFYPASCVVPVSKLASKALGGIPVPEFTCDSHCGAATYIFKDGDRIIPIASFVDVDAFFQLIRDSYAEDLEKTIGKTKAVARLYLGLNRIIDKEKAPENFDLAGALAGILMKKKDALVKFHWDSMMIGAMHFMDPYNYDTDRVQRCVIHYAVPDGRIIPFCAFNVLPEFYREAINKKFGILIDEWEKQTGKKLDDDLKRI